MFLVLKGPLQRILNLDFNQWAIKFALSWIYNFKNFFFLIFLQEISKRKRFCSTGRAIARPVKQILHRNFCLNTKKSIPEFDRMWHVAFNTNFNSTCHTRPRFGMDFFAFKRKLRCKILLDQSDMRPSEIYFSKFLEKYFF